MIRSFANSAAIAAWERRCIKGCPDDVIRIASRKLMWIIMEDEVMADFPPVHPGEVLKKDFLKPAGIGRYAPAKALGVPQIRISQMANGKRAITPDTALRLARHFGTTPEFWLGMQMRYDLEVARERVGDIIRREVEPRAA